MGDLMADGESLAFLAVLAVDADVVLAIDLEGVAGFVGDKIFVACAARQRFST